MPILGTTPEMIDSAEDRHKFSALVDQIGLEQVRTTVTHAISLSMLVVSSWVEDNGHKAMRFNLTMFQY